MSNDQKNLLPIRNLSDCERILAAARFKTEGKPLGKNTRLLPLHGGEYAIRYYQTDVVTWHRDGTFTLDNGTWQTASTRDWMEAAAPVSIRQVKGKWEIRINSILGDKWEPYYNGMRIDPESRTHRLAG